MADIKNLVKELSDDLESFITGYYYNTLDYPSQRRKFDRDMEVVLRARKYLDEN